ncbi:MAG: epoxyqueuosine reductase [Acidimicrobiia bacterium]
MAVRRYRGMFEGLTDELAAVAGARGASSFGVAGAQRFERELVALQAGKVSGRDGSLRFTYDDPDLGTDVTRSFPWAKRIVVIGRDYLAEADMPAGRGAIVGRFATSDHYEAVREITTGLAAKLHEEGYRAEVLIDDNRLVDRAAAARAGVGWVGRSTMVLAPGHGPWMLLGSVVTDAPLTISAPMQRDCGTCVACVPACPTGALDERGLDARRCLSAWLQSPGSIPHWIRMHLGRRIYGCDDCLTACPPGKRALAAAGEDRIDLPFHELLASSDDELLHRFHWWYVPRRQGRFLRRNLLVAAGNSAEVGARSQIEAHLDHRSSMIRGHAAWAMARAFPAIARNRLRQALETETVAEAVDELALALLMVEHPGAHRVVLAADEWARSQAMVRGLALIGPHAAAEPGDDSSLGLLLIHRGPEPPPTPELPVRFETAPLGDGLDLAGTSMARVYDPDGALDDLRRKDRGRRGPHRV